MISSMRILCDTTNLVSLISVFGRAHACPCVLFCLFRIFHAHTSVYSMQRSHKTYTCLRICQHDDHGRGLHPEDRRQGRPVRRSSNPSWHAQAESLSVFFSEYYIKLFLHFYFILFILFFVLSYTRLSLYLFPLPVSVSSDPHSHVHKNTRPRAHRASE